MKMSMLPRTALTLALATVVVPAAFHVAPVSAQEEQEDQSSRRRTGGADSASERARERRNSEKGAAAEKQVEKFPGATRKAPGLKPSSKASAKLQKMVKLYNDDKPAE